MTSVQTLWLLFGILWLIVHVLISASVPRDRQTGWQIPGILIIAATWILCWMQL